MDDMSIDKEEKTIVEVSDETINEILELDTEDVAVEELIKDDLSPKHTQSKVIEKFKFEDESSSGSDDDDNPDVEDIADPKIYEDNHCGCVLPSNSKLDALREVFDEETCTDVLIGYYDACKDMKLDPEETSSFFQGCEFDYTSNTYRLHITLSAGSVTVGENFMVIKVDGATDREEVVQNEPIVIELTPIKEPPPNSPEPDSSDDGPEVEDIKNPKDNHCGCVMNSNSKLDALREVFDEETCADVLIGYYDAMKDMKLNPNETSAMFHGCEFDYTSNTYRLHITLSAGSVTIAENFMVIKVDGATGFPKICSIR